jgi:hypothetical protein
MKHNRPRWEPDAGATVCGQCKVSFSFDVRRVIFHFSIPKTAEILMFVPFQHHCRHCGRIFCHYCSSKSRSLLSLGYSEPVRICDKCFEVTVRRGEQPNLVVDSPCIASVLSHVYFPR